MSSDLDDLENRLMCAIHEIFLSAKGIPEKNQKPDGQTSARGTTCNWNPDSLKWKEAKGEKGLYERADINDNSQSADFSAMVQDLENHERKLSRSGLFYWLFTDKKAVGRKPLVRKQR